MSLLEMKAQQYTYTQKPEYYNFNRDMNNQVLHVQGKCHILNKIKPKLDAKF